MSEASPIPADVTGARQNAALYRCIVAATEKMYGSWRSRLATNPNDVTPQVGRKINVFAMNLVAEARRHARNGTLDQLRVPFPTVDLAQQIATAALVDLDSGYICYHRNDESNPFSIDVGYFPSKVDGLFVEDMDSSPDTVGGTLIGRLPKECLDLATTDADNH